MKNILWITNILLPDAAKYLNKKEVVFGGWMVGLLDSLKVEKKIKFGIASVYKGKELISFEKNGMSYFLLPISGKSSEYEKNLERYWEQVNAIFAPDITHIHGTEHSHGLAMVNACPNNKYVVSIQGLVSVYSRYYFSGLTIKDIFSNFTIRDFLKGSIIKNKNDFKKRGLNEKKYIQKVGNVIGRTKWDEVHSYIINKERKYYFCNESLRPVFYSKKYSWDVKNVERYSIFLSQAGYPIKGLHFVLKAIALIKDEFPTVKIYIAGKDIINNKKLSDKIKKDGYGNYISKLIEKLQLKNHVNFIGFLNEKEMAQRYEKSNVFVCPSSIENSPNSLGEAQILGVPCVASYVGGIPDMITHEKSGLLYRFEEFEMLAFYLRRIFNNVHFAKTLSINGKTEAEQRHNKEKNKNKTIEIYNKISEKKGVFYFDKLKC